MLSGKTKPLRNRLVRMKNTKRSQIMQENPRSSKINCANSSLFTLEIVHLRGLLEALPHRAHPRRTSRRTPRDDAQLPGIRIAGHLRTEHRREAEVSKWYRPGVD